MRRRLPPYDVAAPKYLGSGRLTSTEPITVSYEVYGGDDDPKVNRFTLLGEQVRYDQEELIRTSSSTTELTAKVTEVLP